MAGTHGPAGTKLCACVCMHVQCACTYKFMYTCVSTIITVSMSFADAVRLILFTIGNFTMTSVYTLAGYYVTVAVV